MEGLARSPKKLGSDEGNKFQILAETGFLKLSGDETGGACAIMEGHTPPRAGPPPHRHSREDESFYILEGEYEFIVGGQTIYAPAGTFLFGPRGVAHSFKNIGTTLARMLIVAQPAGVEKLFEEISELTASGAPDLNKLMELAASYGIEILF